MPGPLSARRRILAFWAASDYADYFTPAFLENPDFEVEIVSGHRTSGKSAHAAGPARVARLRERVKRGDFDLIISGNIWNSAWPPHKQLATRLAQAFRFYTYKRGMLDTYLAPGFARLAARVGVPFVTLDLRDPCFVYPWDWPLLRDSFLYFKRELFFWPVRSLGPLVVSRGAEAEACAGKLRPLSYGVPRTRIPETIRPFAERDIDVFMSGMMNPLRHDLMRRLERLKGEFNIEIHDKVSRKLYPEKLSRSKLVLCVESFGCETWRMYEASAAGAVPLLNWPYVQNAFPLEPDRHAIYYSYIGDDFERQIRSALAQPEKLAAISRATHQFTSTYKDRAALGRYVVETALEEFRRNRHPPQPAETAALHPSSSTHHP
jgi:hypothetical protein